MIYQIIFIGAGFSNLAAANRMHDLGISNFSILEKGNRYAKRDCSGEHSYTCKQCPICNTIEGVGGANALHGNKLCYLPASKNITNGFSRQDINESLDYLSKLLGYYFDADFNVLVDTTKPQIGYKKKYYFSDVYFQRDFAKIVQLLINRIENNIFENHDVSSIEKTNSFYNVKTKSGQIFKAKHIVFGTGRTSYQSLPNLLKPLGGQFVQQPQDIGIRIEANCDCFTDLYYYQIDPKIKFDFGDSGSSRTFCAHNKGKVVPVRFGNSFFADGAFNATPTTKNNIAIMTRTANLLTNTTIENWLQTVNNLAGNTLFLGNILLDNHFIDNFKKLTPAFPTEGHYEIMLKTLHRLLYGNNAIIKKDSLVSIYAPAIDLQWAKPKLKNDFSLYSDDNIYVIGDAAGKSRGFVQALFSGVIWANMFQESLDSERSSRYSLDLIDY